MRGNPGAETLAVRSGLAHSSDSQPVLREGMASKATQPQDWGLTSESEGRRLTPPQQPRQAQHAPRRQCFHPPTPSRKAPHKIPANAAPREGQSLARKRVPAKFSEVEGEQLFKNWGFFL